MFLHRETPSFHSSSECNAHVLRLPCVHQALASLLMFSLRGTLTLLLYVASSCDMVLLPCPRLQRAMEDDAGSTDGSDHDSLSTSTYDPSLAISDDGDDAFEPVVVEQPATGPTVTVTSSDSVVLSMSGGLTCATKSKKGRLSLLRLSDRIRGRLSREARLARKFPAITGASPEREPHDRIKTAKVASASTEILENIAASDGDYDSDARNILTPQIAAQLGVNSPDASSTQLPDVPSDHEDHRGPSQQRHNPDGDGAAIESAGPDASSMAVADGLTPAFSNETRPASGSSSEVNQEKVDTSSFRKNWNYLVPVYHKSKLRRGQKDDDENPKCKGFRLVKPPCSSIEEGKHPLCTPTTRCEKKRLTVNISIHRSIP